MKKSIILALASFVVALGFVGCKDVTSDGLTGITYYATMTMNGDSEIWISTGDSFEDPGCVTLLEGEEVEADVISDLDTSTPGIYTIKYSYTNVDGFSASASRTIYVAAAGEVIESGIYYTTGNTTIAGSVVTSGCPEYVLALGDGVYYISELIGGYWSYYVGYGANYGLVGYVQLEDDNTLTHITSEVPGWGDTLNTWYGGSYDPATGMLNWSLNYYVYDCVVEIAK